MSRCASEATARVRAAVRNVRRAGFDACNCTALRPCQLSDGIHVDCASLRAKTWIRNQTYIYIYVSRNTWVCLCLRNLPFSCSRPWVRADRETIFRVAYLRCIYIYIIPIFCQGDGLRTTADRRLCCSSLAWAGAVMPRYRHIYIEIYIHIYLCVK